ncbi:unnamed protein product [Arctogadus glacialis]
MFVNVKRRPTEGPGGGRRQCRDSPPPPPPPPCCYLNSSPDFTEPPEGIDSRPGVRFGPGFVLFALDSPLPDWMLFSRSGFFLFLFLFRSFFRCCFFPPLA